MGNFGGHAMPGSFFIIIGLWHLINLYTSYFRAKRRIGPPFKSATYVVSPCCPRFPLEPTIKLIVITGGLISEIITGFKGHVFANIGNGQHICMYAFFGFTSFLEILAFYNFNLPSGIIHVFYALSFAIETILFYWHLHVQKPLEVQVHMFLIYVAIATICAVFVEMKYRRLILPALFRTFFILFHGVWFWQIAFILYAPAGWEQWDWENHEQMMLVTIIFCADLFLTLVFCLVCWFIVACLYGSIRQEQKVEVKNGYKPAPQTEASFTNEFRLSQHGFDDDEEALISE